MFHVKHFRKIELRLAGAMLRSAFTLLALFIIPGTASATPFIARPTITLAWRLYLPLIIQPADAPATPRPTWGGPLAISSIDGSIWVVNPDAGSVSVVAPQPLAKVAEIKVGEEPWSLALSPNGAHVYITDRAKGTLVVVDAQTHAVQTTIPVGPEPAAVVLSPTSPTAYVTLNSADEVAVVDTQQMTITAHIPVGPHPYAIAIDPGNTASNHAEQIYVTHLLARPQPGKAEATDDQRVGVVSVIDAATKQVVRELLLPPDEHGFPNLLTSITLNGPYAWVPQERAAPALPNGLTTTLFAAVSTLDLANSREDTAARLALNDQDVFGSPVNNPVAAVPAPDGKTLYVVLAGSNLLEVIDITEVHQPRLVKFLPTGQNPRGLALSQDGRRGYVLNYLARSLTVFDLEQLAVSGTITVTPETLAPTILQGKILFNNAADPRLSQGSWMSCTSCHPDGGADGVTWIFPDGPRQTPPLWNAGQTLPWHWSAALDEPQDVEETIQLIQHGVGLAPGADPPQLGAPKAGRSTDLDALAAFLEQGIRTPAAPPPAGDLAEGRRLFIAKGCAACHGGATWTSSRLYAATGTLDPDGNGMIDSLLHDVHTQNPADVRGLTGFDVPSLLNVGLTAPYLHDGLMPTLTALLQAGHPNPTTAPEQLTPDEITAFVAFLNSIGPNTNPIAQP